jgi:hypothetical protein
LIEGPLTFVTGASGYVGGRLVPELERDGRRVRCLARRPGHVRPRVGAATEVVAGDLLDAASLKASLAGVDAACYLVHSMGSRGDFEVEDRRAATNFAAAARAAGVRRIVYLGGPDRVSYADLMREYARQRGLRRLMLRVPVLSPRLSSPWLGLVTPLYARVGRELVESTRNPTVVDDDSARRLFPELRPRGVREAIARALRNEERALAETRWSDALSSGDTRAWGGSASARAWWTRAPCACRAPRTRCSCRCAGSAARPAGTTATGCGACAVSSTGWWAASACGAAAEIPNGYGPATRSTAPAHLRRDAARDRGGGSAPVSRGRRSRRGRAADGGS